MKSICARCQSTAVVPGHLELAGSDGWVTPSRFFPEGLRFFTFKRSVELKKGQQFFACLSCGLVWSELKPDDLMELLESKGAQDRQHWLDNLKKQLKSLDK